MLTLADAEKLVHAFSPPGWTTVMRSSSGSLANLQKLQYIQNSAARIRMRVRKYDHITPILKTWLPFSFRIVYNVSLLTHQCIHGNAPSYLKELLTHNLPNVTPFCFNILLKTPRTKLRTMEIGAFCSAAPSCGMLFLIIYGLHNL